MRGSIAARWATLLVVVLVVGTTSAAAATSPTASSGSAWSIQQTLNVNAHNELNAVSCTGPDWCMAVGIAWYDGGLFSEAWDGTSWSLSRIPDASSGRRQGLHDVSCSSPTSCIAVGETYTRDGSFSWALAYRWDGTRWSSLPMRMPDEGQSMMYGVSCVADGCMAVGFKGFGGLMAEWWNGSTWTIEPIFEPASRWSDSIFLGVSCTSPAACVAVGWDVLSQPVTARWDGITWSLMKPAIHPGMMSSGLAAVSCTGPAACIAVGSEQPVCCDGLPLVERWDGSAWTIESTPFTDLARRTLLEGVSCGGPSDCVAVGSADAFPVIARWNGVRWTFEAVPEPPGSRWAGLNGVSCSGQACTAVGGFSDGSNVTRTLAERSAP